VILNLLFTALPPPRASRGALSVLGFEVAEIVVEEFARVGVLEARAFQMEEDSGPIVVVNSLAVLDPAENLSVSAVNSAAVWGVHSKSFKVANRLHYARD
jgi:hypothetical protein